MRSHPLRVVSVLSGIALTVVLAAPGSAHPVGQCTADTALDRCERWSRVYNDTTRTAPHRPDEFATAVASSQAAVFTAVRSVGIDQGNPYEAGSDWVVLAHATGNGELLWEARRRTRHYDSPLAAVTSTDGRVLYVTGAAYDGFPITATDSRLVTVAYDAATGDELWSSTWDGRPDGTDTGKQIGVTSDGRTVIVGGVSVTETDGMDYVTVAYDAQDGSERWVRTHNGLRPQHSSDVLDGLAVSPRNDLVYVTGESAGMAEFDADYVTIAYDVLDGTIAWEQRFTGLDQGGADRANAIAVSEDGRQVFVTGDSYRGRPAGAAVTQYDYATVAYDARTGTQQWVGRYGGPVAGFNSPVAIAAPGNRVIVTGQSRGATADDVRDYGTVAYAAGSGIELWQARYAPPRSDEVALDLAVSPDGQTAFVTGSSSPAIPYTDLDEAVTVAYRTTDGAQQWVSSLSAGLLNAVLGRQLAATPDGGVALVGQVTYSADPLKPPSQNIYDTVITRY
jgi:hypothetical protein